MTEVDVVTGKVRFAAGKEPEPVILTAGMSASYSNEKKEIDILKEENPNNLSWKTKQLRFNDTPLEKVIRDLNEYYKGGDHQQSGFAGFPTDRNIQRSAS